MKTCMTVQTKPSANKNRIALILQARYDKPCWWQPCDSPTVRVATFGEPGEKFLEVRHLCDRHKQMGMW